MNTYNKNYQISGSAKLGTHSNMSFKSNSLKKSIIYNNIIKVIFKSNKPKWYIIHYFYSENSSKNLNIIFSFISVDIEGELLGKANHNRFYKMKFRIYVFITKNRLTMFAFGCKIANTIHKFSMAYPKLGGIYQLCKSMVKADEFWLHLNFP